MHRALRPSRNPQQGPNLFGSSRDTPWHVFAVICLGVCTLPVGCSSPCCSGAVNRANVAKPSYETRGLAIGSKSLRVVAAPDGTMIVHFSLGVGVRVDRSWGALCFDLVKVGERKREARKVPDVKRGWVERPACTVFMYEVLLKGVKRTREVGSRHSTVARRCTVSLGKTRGYTEVEIRFGAEVIGFHVTP